LTTPLSVLLYSHDSQGLGHVRRNLALAHHIAARAGTGGLRGLVVSGLAAVSGRGVFCLETAASSASLSEDFISREPYFLSALSDVLAASFKACSGVFLPRSAAVTASVIALSISGQPET